MALGSARNVRAMVVGSARNVRASRDSSVFHILRDVENIADDNIYYFQAARIGTRSLLNTSIAR